VRINADFGVSEGTVNNLLRRADIEDGTRRGVTVAEPAELREFRERNRLLELENELLRRAVAYLAQANLTLESVSPEDSVPAGPRACCGRRPRIPISGTCWLPGFSKQAHYQ
jgi:transposase-like protein